MNWSNIIWDSTPGGNVEHVEEHDLLTDEVDHVPENFEARGVSQSSGRPCVFGYTPDGRCIIVVFEEVDASSILSASCSEDC